MHLNLGLAKTINRATHVTRGFRRIVMVTAAGEGRPGRLVADLTNEFSRRGIDVSQLPIEGSEDTRFVNACPGTQGASEMVTSPSGDGAPRTR